MSFTLEFSEDQLDALRELFNISIGSASAVVAEMMEVFVVMRVPELTLIPLDQLGSYLEARTEPDTHYYLSSQIFSGEFYGESIFYVGREEAGNLAVHLEGRDAAADEEVTIDVFMELANIVATGFLKKLGTLLTSDITLSPPAFEERTGNGLVEMGRGGTRSQVIVADVGIDLESTNLRASFFLLARQEAHQTLQIALDRFIEEYVG